MREYENPMYIHENTEPQRAYYIPYESLEKALAGDCCVCDIFHYIHMPA